MMGNAFGERVHPAVPHAFEPCKLCHSTPAITLVITAAVIHAKHLRPLFLTASYHQKKSVYFLSRPSCDGSYRHFACHEGAVGAATTLDHASGCQISTKGIRGNRVDLNVLLAEFY
jgi:hypothetical protein